jgi:hypothetical protein
LAPAKDESKIKSVSDSASTEVDFVLGDRAIDRGFGDTKLFGDITRPAPARPTQLDHTTAKLRRIRLRDEPLLRGNSHPPFQIRGPLLGDQTSGPLHRTQTTARFKSAAAFARANGTAPQPTSSGKTIRHLLAAEATARSTAPSTRSRCLGRCTTPRARAYMQRKINKGKTKREAMCSLKRHLSPHLYNALTSMPLTECYCTAAGRLNESGALAMSLRRRGLRSSARRRSPGVGWTSRAGGSYRLVRRFIFPQSKRWRWPRQRSES